MDKIALITGASKGIGKEFVTIFAKNGYSLILVARGADELAAIQAEIKSKYQCESKIFSADLTKPENIELFCETFKDDLSHIEVLVNNAGYGIASKFADMEPVDVRGMIELNITSLTLLTHKILPYMLARKSGKILNVASTAAFAPGPFMAMYYASKAYVLSFSEALYEEVKSEGVTVSVLCPGPTESEFSKRAGTDKTKLGKLPHMTGKEVAEMGFQGLMHGKRVIITGISNKIMVVAMWLLPNFIVMKVTGKLSRR